MSDLEHRITRVLGEASGQTVLLASDEDIFAALGIDSIQVIVLVSMLEQEFSVRFEFDDLQNITSIAGIATLVTQRGGY